jgi:superfamily II DNA or RNA helicase
MSKKDDCVMQYYYPTEELKKKYKINCSDKFFVNKENLKEFNNEDFLKFVNEKYGDSVFNGDSPFTFKDDYIDLTNEEICKTDEYTLKPQQKFMGQFINPATNQNSTLVFHGLGSGKTCTSLVIGEAFKTTSRTKLLYVVPKPLINQLKDEILGELKTYTDDTKEPEIWSCTSQCEINGKRDFYTNVNDRLILKFYEENYKEKLNKLTDDLSTTDFRKLQNEVNIAKNQRDKFKERLMSNVTKVFQIESHNVFINRLFKVTKDGTWTKKEHLTNKDSPLLSSNGLLVIDEIQRLVSASGVLYKKLFTAIYQFMNPKARIVLLSATPIYDNPYELALTMNLLRPRVPYPLNKEKFYSFFLGKYNDDDECIRIEKKNFISNDSCVINKNLLRILSSGYVSYFRGGNPMAYPYKRIIIMEHRMAAKQKEQYIEALKSDVQKDYNFYSKLLDGDEFLIQQNNQVENENENEDSVSGIYVTTQQFCNIALPIIKSDVIDNMLNKKSKKNISQSLDLFKNELNKVMPKTSINVLDHIRTKGYSEKFVNIIKLSLDCNGPVFIFSNWLQFGVESLSIILEACGFTKFTKEGGENKYFIWNSETSGNDELTSNAKRVFNSMENKDGSLLKIILGTRSIMEGVSFKNVKQVHITDPWWNEARIEQILARAVRFCSHTNLPLDEQHTDVFRHYTILPIIPDPDVSEMLLESTGLKNFKDFSALTIEQKMSISSLKKYQINNEFEETLKQTAYDCDLNQKGNIIRLEENCRPLTNGNYQIYFKNPKTLEIYVREGIPNEVTFDEIIERKYSYPNDVDLPIKFTEIEIEGDTINLLEDSILDESNISKNLTLYENIKCWNKNLTVENIFDEIYKIPENRDIIQYFIKIKKNFDLYKVFRENIHGEKVLDKRIEFKNIEKELKGKQKLIECLKALSESDLTPPKQKTQIKKLLQSKESKEKMNTKIIDIVYKYKYLPETMIEQIQNLDSKSLNELLKEAINYSERE